LPVGEKEPSLKAQLLGLPLALLLGAARDSAAVYGSGGFTSYSTETLQEQLGGWVEEGIPRVKMKIGTHSEDDLDCVRAARNTIGEQAQLFGDANGAYRRKQVLAFAESFAELDGKLKGTTGTKDKSGTDKKPGGSR
jgi:L-alanine-DL-glutamate epimerase-like enolase superfamily enzyme